MIHSNYGPQSELAILLCKLATEASEKTRIVPLIERHFSVADYKEICSDLYWSCEAFSPAFLGRLLSLDVSELMRFVMPTYTSTCCASTGCRECINILCADRDECDRVAGMDIFCVGCSEAHHLESLRSRCLEQEEAENLVSARRVAELRAIPYQEYLKTDHWQSVRARAHAADGNACRVCGSTEGLNVHHRTYERRGCESPGDVITLCQPCHQLFHDHGKLAKPPDVHGQSTDKADQGATQ